jgi:ankyrin repeat protein
VSGCHNLIVSAFQKPLNFESIYSESFDDVFVGTKVEVLARAVYNRDIKGVKQQLDNGISPNLTGKQGVTPLMLALLVRHKKIFEYLLINGADPNIVQENGDSVMFVAAGTYDSSYYLDKALKYGGDPNCYSPAENRYCIHKTISMHMNERQSMLVKAGADLNVEDGLGYTPLIESIVLYNLELSYLLLESGANPYIKNKFDKSFFHYLEENRSTGKNIIMWKGRVIEYLKANWNYNN